MIALNVETFGHAFRVGEGWRIDEDHIKLLIAHAKIREAVGLYQAMLTPCQIVNPQVFLSPLEISTGHIDGGSTACATQSCVNTGGTGIGKQVEEVFTFAHFPKHLASNAVIEEQAGI